MNQRKWKMKKYTKRKKRKFELVQMNESKSGRCTSAYKERETARQLSRGWPRIVFFVPLAQWPKNNNVEQSGTNGIERL